MNKALLLVTSLLLIPAAANAASPAERDRLSQEASGEIRESVKELKGDALERRQMIKAGDREGVIAKTKEIHADRRELRGEIRNHHAAREGVEHRREHRAERHVNRGERHINRGERRAEHQANRGERRSSVASRHSGGGRAVGRAPRGRR